MTQTIQGMGGVGKTTVAAALAEAQGHQLDVVWWVRAEQPAVLVADLAELAPRVGAPLAENPADTGTAVRAWLETTSRPWLVVFDNAPDEVSIEPWRPRRGQGATVVTSRNRNMGRIGAIIAVDTFPPEVAEAFLRERVRPRNPVAAAEVVGTAWRPLKAGSERLADGPTIRVNVGIATEPACGVLVGLDKAGPLRVSSGR